MDIKKKRHDRNDTALAFRNYRDRLSTTLILQSVLGQTRSHFQDRDLHRVRSCASSFNFQYSQVPQGNTVAAYLFLFVFPSLISFPLSFLQLRVLEGSSYTTCEQSSFPSYFLLFVGYTSPLLFYVIPLRFSHDRSNWSSSSFSSTKLQSFPGVCNLISEVSNFQHHTKL